MVKLSIRQVLIYKKDFILNLNQMPVLKPIPIVTKGLQFHKAVWKWLKTKRKFVFHEDWYFELPNGKVVFIPKGFITDGASVPKIFWFILSHVGILLIPAILHDFAYKFRALILVNNDKMTFEIMPVNKREKADTLFWYTATWVNGLDAINKVSWAFLRCFGMFAWNKHRKGDNKRNIKDDISKLNAMVEKERDDFDNKKNLKKYVQFRFFSIH